MLRRVTRLREEVALWREIERRLDESLDLLELMDQEDDSSFEELLAELSQTANDTAGELDRLEFRLTLGGDHDPSSAIVAIHAGAGGTEAQDWAEILLRMYLRWSERREFASQVLDLSSGEEAGVKSVMFQVEGEYAYGNLKAERGVHRLVRLSPFDSAHRRHTSFALVEVMPDVGQAVEVEVDLDDVRVDVFRSSGAGGQSVQKNSTAVRLTHVPTGIVVTCQNERSQLQNRENAMRVLQSRLVEIEEEKKEAELAKLKGEHISPGWGNQIRSYVLHPYNMVKDLRTEFESSNPTAVLDGELDSFIDAYLKSRIGSTDATPG